MATNSFRRQTVCVTDPQKLLRFAREGAHPPHAPSPLLVIHVGPPPPFRIPVSAPVIPLSPHTLVTSSYPCHLTSLSPPHYSCHLHTPLSPHACHLFIPLSPPHILVTSHPGHLLTSLSPHTLITSSPSFLSPTSSLWSQSTGCS